jgi:hypothetical protein
MQPPPRVKRIQEEMPGFGNTYMMVPKDDGITVKAEVETSLLQRFFSFFSSQSFLHTKRQRNRFPRTVP